MKLLPLTTRKQLPNPHRVSHQVSKSTHLCTITREDNKRCDARNALGDRIRRNPPPGKAKGLLWVKSRPYLSMITGSEGVSFLLPQLFLSQHRLRNNCKERFQDKVGQRFSQALPPPGARRGRRARIQPSRASGLRHLPSSGPRPATGAHHPLPSSQHRFPPAPRVFSAGRTSLWLS